MLALPAATAARAAGDPITVPAGLQTEVNFWIRVYTEISTSEGFLHDQDDLGVVYRTLRFADDVSPRTRRHAVNDERKKIEAMLRHLASGSKDLTADEKKIAAMFGDDASRSRFAHAARNVRFQLGQSDRFREGLERSSQWERHIEQTLADMGLPPQLAVLPHVESSFDPTAYSKVGAAGLWQFMRGTGRRFLHIDDAVDERMDPFLETEAAAQLLDYNYRVLGTWPLAVTAYNHGAAGMRRAVRKLGTTDIVTIIHKYKSRTFGFASRNFYPSFLAALTISRNVDKYFPNLKRRPEMSFTEVEMPAYVPLAVLVKTLKVSRERLTELNPAFRPALLSGSRYVPKGYMLRLPADAKDWSTRLLAQRIDTSNQYVNQPRPRTYRVRRGDALSIIAARYGLSVGMLADANNMSTRDMLRAGRVLRLPESPATRVAAARAAEAAGEPGATAKPVVASTKPAAPQPPPEQVSETLADQREEVAAITRTEEPAEPVSASEAEDSGPSLVPGGAVARPSESTDYSVDDDHTIRVAAEETIGHYADWLDTSASHVRHLNRLRYGTAIALGRKIKLDFSSVSVEQFEAKRRDYHEQLEAAFFANHRIIGTQVHTVRSGDSLWNLAQGGGQLPIWLVTHYNPDIDFSALRPGQEIVVPKVELVEQD